MVFLIRDVLIQTIQIYNFLLIIRILLTWFPNIDSTNPIISNLYSITDPYLNIFRGVIPPIGGLDLSPILAFISLNLIQSLIAVLAGYAYQLVGIY